MAFTPTTKKFTLPVLAFDGGLNTKYVDLNTPINQTPDCYGVIFDDFGAVGSAKGFEKLNATSIASAPIDGLHEYIDLTTTRRFIAVCGDTAYTWSPNWEPISGSTGVYQQYTHTAIRTVDDYAVFTDGMGVPHKWDGGYFTQLGVSSVSANAATAATEVAAGSLTGTYRWALTGVNSGYVEGDYAIITSQIVLASQYATVSAIPVFPASAGVDTKNLYRNKAAGSNIFYYVTSVSNAQTAYTDNTIDGSLGAEAPEDNGAAPVVKWIIEHRNRAFGAGNSNYPQRLYFSQAGQVETWPSTNYVDIGAGDGQPITGIMVYGNSLFLHKSDNKGHGSIWGVYMPDSASVTGTSNWYVDKVAVAEGGIGQRSIVLYGNIMGFLNPYGFFGFTGAELAQSPAYASVGTFPVNSLSFLIEPTLKAWKQSLIGNAAAIDFDNKVWLAVPSAATSTYNDSVYIFDYLRASQQDQVSGAWSRMRGNVNCWSPYDGGLYAGSSAADGYVYKWNTGHSAAGSAIDSYFYTIWISGLPEHQDNTKTFRFLYLWYETSGDWDLEVTYWVDFSTGITGQQLINLSSGGTAWGSLIWGVDKWGSGNNVRMTRVILSGTKGRAIQFRFRTSTVDQYFKVIKCQLDYNLTRIRD
jgi:hypothetical protein